MGVAPADAAGGLDAFTRYRLLGLPQGSVAGAAVRWLIDQGRGGDADTALPSGR